LRCPLLLKENIILDFGFTAAAYHGGKLNGVDCHELIRLANKFLNASKLVCSVFHILTSVAKI
jgi:hypothetical protein